MGQGVVEGADDGNTGKLGPEQRDGIAAAPGQGGLVKQHDTGRRLRQAIQGVVELGIGGDVVKRVQRPGHLLAMLGIDLDHRDPGFGQRHVNGMVWLRAHAVAVFPLGGGAINSKPRRVWTRASRTASLCSTVGMRPLGA